MQKGLFREDLDYRINVFPVHLPALRERVDDIPLLAQSLLAKIVPQASYTLTADTQTPLQRIPFNGNIRELRNILERAVLLSATTVIDADLLRDCLDIEELVASTPLDLKALELEYIQRLLKDFNEDEQAVADQIGISVRTLYRKLH